MQPHPDLLPGPEVAPLAIRDGRDADAPGIIALIAGCWGEYPGCIDDLEGELPELAALASHVADRKGRLWVAETAAGRLVGMIAAYPHGEAGTWQVGRMYVDASERGGGLAGCLLAGAEAHARSRGAERMVLWSDTRFGRAHRFYEKHSYIRTGTLRALDDVSRSLEFKYRKPLTGLIIEELDTRGADSAAHRLAGILIACVEAGASASFRRPLRQRTAQDFWHATTREVASGRRVLLVAWRAGVLVGTVQLGFPKSENQPHRLDVLKLLVHPDARRQGIARALLAAGEQAARRRGRTLLVLDTRAGDGAEALYRSLGWTEVGTIPDFALDADGQRLEAITIFCKRLRGA